MTTSCFRVCNAVQDQYYRHEGLYLQSADKEKIDEIFARAAQKGAPMVCFQCADDTVYQEVYRLLIEEQGIFAYLPESETTARTLIPTEKGTFISGLQVSRDGYRTDFVPVQETKSSQTRRILL